MAGGRKSGDKGNRAERAIVRFPQDQGFAVQRVPLPGSVVGSYVGDLTASGLGTDGGIEAKVRAYGFGELHRALEDREILIVKPDQEPLVVMPLRPVAEVAPPAEANR
jgi:Holliday junction resolvase